LSPGNLPGNLLYFRSARREARRTVMDKFWSILAMPLGVILCFGPGMIVWWLTRDKKPPPPGHERHD